MPLLHPPGRRFSRTSEYSHEQRRNRMARVRERIDLLWPGGRARPGPHLRPHPQAQRPLD